VLGFAMGQAFSKQVEHAKHLDWVDAYELLAGCTSRPAPTSRSPRPCTRHGSQMSTAWANGRGTARRQVAGLAFPYLMTAAVVYRTPSGNRRKASWTASPRRPEARLRLIDRVHLAAPAQTADAVTCGRSAVLGAPGRASIVAGAADTQPPCGPPRDGCQSGARRPGSR
jgi:hypothetical protein